METKLKIANFMVNFMLWPALIFVIFMMTIALLFLFIGSCSGEQLIYLYWIWLTIIVLVLLLMKWMQRVAYNFLSKKEKI